MIIFFFRTTVASENLYSNVWAVKVKGSQQEVEELAQRYGFSYDRHVSSTYMFKHFSFLILKHIASHPLNGSQHLRSCLIISLANV